VDTCVRLLALVLRVLHEEALAPLTSATRHIIDADALECLCSRVCGIAEDGTHVRIPWVYKRSSL
jgi:hypothetical protein